jgi:hypothetical protein
VAGLCVVCGITRWRVLAESYILCSEMLHLQDLLRSFWHGGVIGTRVPVELKFHESRRMSRLIAQRAKTEERLGNPRIDFAVYDVYQAASWQYA